MKRAKSQYTSGIGAIPYMRFDSGGAVTTTGATMAPTVNTDPLFKSPYQTRQIGGTLVNFTPSVSTGSTGGSDADSTQTQTLSSWAGPYVERLLQEGEAFASIPYTSYDKPLSTAFTDPQNTALTGINALAQPGGFQDAKTTLSGIATDSTGMFDPKNIDPNTGLPKYMSLFMSGVVDPQLREARRQADITRMQNAARMAKAGSFGGSRQAIQEAELNRNLATQLGDIYGAGQQKAFENAQAQFEKDRQLQLALAGQQSALGTATQAADLSRLQAQYGMGEKEQATRQAAIDRDRAEFEREQYKYPMEMLNLRKGLLSNLPVATSKYYEQGQSAMQNAAALAGIAANLKNAGFDISNLFSGVDLSNIFGGTSSTSGGGLGDISFGDPNQGPN